MFRLSELPPGEHVLTLQADGYRKLTRALDLSDGPPRGMLSFVLVPTD